MKTPSFQNRTLARLSACFISLAIALPVMAATDSWTGGGTPDGNWNNPANWGGVTPASADLLNFTTGNQLLATNNFTAGTIFGNLSFDGSAGSFLLSGNSLILTNGTDAGGGNTTGGSITNLSPNAETNLIPITLSAGKHSIANMGTGKLYLNGAFTRNTGAVLVFTNSGGGINVAGGLGTNGQNNIIGGWAVISNDWAAIDAVSNVIPFTAYTAMSSGAIANNAAANIKFVGDSADLTAANGTVVNSIVGQITSARNVTIATGGTMKLGAHGGIYRNAGAGAALTVKAANSSGAFLTASGGGEITLADGPFSATSGNLTVSAFITNDAANVVSVNVLGYVTLSGNNGFSGGTYIDQGRVSANTLSAFGTGPVSVYPGAEAFLNATGNFTNNFSISGIGATETSGGQNLGAIRYGATATNIGIITLVGNARITGASGGNNSLLGKITGPGRLEFTAATGNNSSINLNEASGLNDWSGGLQITVGGSGAGRQVYVKLGASEEIPDGAGKGDVTLNCTTDIGRFDLNGFNETINGLNSALNVNNQVQNNGSGPCTLTLGNNNATGTFGGVISDNGNPLSIVKIGSGRETFAGANTYNGSTLVLGGTLALSNTATLTSPINVSNSTLDVSVESAAFTLGTVSLYSNATMLVSMTAQPTITTLNITNSSLTTAIPLNPITNVVVNTLVAGGTANPINISALPGITSYPQQFALIQYANNTGNAGTFVLGTMPGTYTGFISNDIVNSIIWLVATNGPEAKPVVWNGNVNGNWDTATLNWLTGGNHTNYNQGDFVTFDDTLTGTPNVNLTTVMTPFTLTVSNSVANYIFNGSGRITGVTGLNKQGTASLLIDNAGIDDFSGASQIAAGTVQVGNNDANGGLGTGSLTNSGTLNFDRTDNYTNVNSISGVGSIAQNGNGTLTLNGNNAAFAGPVNVSAGFLKAGTATALGASNTTTIASGATLDVNGQTLTNQTVVVSGTGVGGIGAIISGNSAIAQLTALTNITMVGNTTIGGVGRWDVRSGGAGVNMQNFTLTKIGTNQISFVSAVITNVNLVINQGLMDMETATVTLPNSGLITVNAGGILGLFDNPANTFLCPVTLNGGTIRNLGGTIAALDAPVTLTASSFLDSGGANPGMVINTAIGQSGGSFGLTKLSAGGFFLGGANTYSGPTIVTGGTLALTNNGTIASTAFISVSNATLDTSGVSSPATLCTNNVMLTSNATISVSGYLEPFMGGLGMTNSTIRLVQAQVSTTPSLVATNLAFGPPTNFLNLVSFVSTPSVNQFPLIGYSTLTGTFNLGVSGMPANYAGFLSNNVANGTIDLVLTASPATVNWTGNNNAVDSYWSDALNWNGLVPIQDNLLNFSGGAGLVNTNNLAANMAFSGIAFGSGPYVLNGNPVVLVAGSSIANNSGSAEIVNLPISTSGTNLTLSGNSSGLTIGGGITNTAGGQEFLTLNGTGIISNSLATPLAGGGLVFLSADGSANWTIADNTSASPVTLTNGGLEIVGGATLNFGNAGSAPNLTFAGVWNADNGVGSSSGTSTFNMMNGTLNLPARINTQGNPGGNINVMGGTLIVANQIQLANGASSDTSTLTMSGGTFTINSGTGTLYIASRGAGTVNMNGGTLNCGRLDLSRNAAGNTAGSVGVFNLNGGVVQASAVSTLSANSQSGGTPTATMNFNGGVLKATGNAANFFQGNNLGATPTPFTPITSIVQAGGAIIDDGGFTITMFEPLQHDGVGLGSTPDGGLLKKGAGILTLTATNTYTGNTVISNGTLLVNGSLGQTFVRVAGGTLGGTGSVGSNVTVSVGGNISPASVGVIGTLTIASNLVLQGNATLAISHTAATSDLINASTITYGGILTVTNLAGVLSTNDIYKLFNATTYSGAFSSISPAIPAPGIGWNTNFLAIDGTLHFVATVNPAPTNITTVISGNQLTLSWPADHIGWRLQAQTNTLGIGLGTNWVDVSGSTSVNSEAFIMNPVNGTVFYRMIYP